MKSPEKAHFILHLHSAEAEDQDYSSIELIIDQTWMLEHCQPFIISGKYTN